MNSPKLALVIFLALLLFDCGKKRPVPQPQPTPLPTPTVEPTPKQSPTPIPVPSSDPSPVPSPSSSPLIPVAWATPWPTPIYNPADYIPAPTQGKIAPLEQVGDEDYAAKIQRAQDDPEIGIVAIGPGSLKRPVILRKRTHIETTPENPLRCDLVEGIPPFNQLIPLSNYGCMLLVDGVHVSGTFKAPKELTDYFKFGDGRNWATDPYFLKLDALTEEQIAAGKTTILEPDCQISSQPCVEVFQALNGVMGHVGLAKNIAITGMVVKGRQRLYDGGVRSTFLLENCHKCTAQENFLWNTASIGITAGGSSEQGNYAQDVLFYLNMFSGVPGANMASINTERLTAVNNYVRRPGNARKMANPDGVIGGGGVCGFDQETNSPGDHTKFIYVVNNLIDFERAYQDGAGNGICMQDPYAGKNREEVVVANNVIIGGRGIRDFFRYMSNGIFLNGLVSPKVINNYVFKTGQNAVQAYNVVDGLIQDNDFEMTGGGGNGTGLFVGVRNTTVRRSHFRSRLNLEINAQSNWEEREGSCGNKFEDVMTNGVVQPQKPSPPCP